MSIRKFNLFWGLSIWFCLFGVITGLSRAIMANQFYPELTYTIQANILPDSSMVKATMEMEFLNTTNDTMDALYFRLNRNAWQPGSYFEKRLLQVNDSSITKLGDTAFGFIAIDSILFRGVPLIDSEMEIENTILKIDLSMR